MRQPHARLTRSGSEAVSQAVVAAAVLLGMAAVASAQARPPDGAVVPPAALAAGAPALAADNPFQCWWRASSGAIRLGEVVDVALTCAVLESGTVTAVADESRLTVAAVQLSPFEIVDGTHPPDVRAADRRFFQYRYRLRIISPDVIGRDVKLPPLAIPYKLQSRMGAATTLAGRDLVHLMPQLVFRVVSQVPDDADDIRDSADASLAEVDRLRFRASAFGVAAMVLAALGALAALSLLLPAAGLLRRRRTVTTARVSERTALGAASRRLAALLDTARGVGWTAETTADAHGAARVVAAIAAGIPIRDVVVPAGAAVPEGRLVVAPRFARRRAAVTAHVTPRHLSRAIEALPATASGGRRARLERLRDALTTLTQAQYTAAEPRDGAAVDDAVAAVRDLGAELARARLLSPREWWRRPVAAAAATPEF